MAKFVQDLRYAFRILLKSPGFTLVAVLTLALGIGANVAFSVVYAVLFRPLPFPQPDQLVRVFDDLRGPSDFGVGMSAPELWDLQEHSGVFEDISAVASTNSAVFGGDRTVRAETMINSPLLHSSRRQPTARPRLNPEGFRAGFPRTVGD
jgi:putative ABC transport system permease protein